MKTLILLLLMTIACQAQGLKIGQTITVTYKITGSGFKTVQANTGKPCWRLMIQKGNDMYSAQGRYWSDAEVILSGGISEPASGRDRTDAGTTAKRSASIPPTQTFSVQIQPDRWTDVYGGKGTEHLAEFKDTLANCGHIGITFGGDAGGYGHGVVGTGTFTLVSMEVK